MSLKQRWLNWMLHFSGVINTYKLKVIETTGPKIILTSFTVLLLEIVNVLISLPAYAFISSKEFAGSDTSAIRTYRLRRIVSLSVLAGTVFSIFVWMLVSFFGLILFPGKSYAAIASWDFNTPLAYNYDTTKIQITDGAAIFKAETPAVDTIETTIPITEPAPTIETVTEPLSAGGSIPVVESTPEPIVEPTPAPVVEPAAAPAADPIPTSPLLFDNLRKIFKPEVAYAQTNTCSATLQTITPLLVTPFVQWTGFSETANKVGGEIYYTLSGDGGTSWLYWNGSSWINAGTNKGNTATEINSHISDFPVTLTDATAGTLMFKATFESDCNQDISLLSLTADYQDQPAAIASFTSPETGAATSTTVVTSEADPTVVAALDSISTGTDTSLATDTTVDTSIAAPIAFSVHIVTETTGTPGSTLYSIPGLLSVSEGPDNGLVVNVTGTNLQTTTLSSSASVAVGDHVIVLVYDGATLKLYIDGAVAASLTTPIVIAPPAQVSTSIGCVSAGFILEALTLAQINANYLECNNQAPQLNITSATQKTDDGFVNIIYTATDANNDFVSIPVYEYSTTGAFAGEESVMTVATQGTDHDGTNGLIARDSGTEHTLVWNVKADLPNYAGNVYVRLRANDGLITGSVETFYPVRIDTKAPVVSSFTGTQTNDSGTVTLSYTLSDTNTPVAVALALSSDNGLTWAVPATSASGAVGDVATGTQVILWDADQDVPNFEGAITARITITDKYANESVMTADFDIDTRAPIGLSAFAGVESNMNQILWRWSPSDDTNFDRYIIAYGTDRETVQLWEPFLDSDLLIAGTDRTVITGLSADTEYFAKITAYDDYGHEQTSAVVSFRTQTESAEENETVEAPLLENSELLPPVPQISIETRVEESAGSLLQGAVADKIVPDLASESGASVSVDGGSGPIISLTTSESRDESENSEINAGVNDNQSSSNNGSSADRTQSIGENSQGGGGLPSSFISTANSVLQNTPELKSIAESRESGVLAKPEVALVGKSITGQTINFTGTGIPKAKIALFIHSDQVVVYTTDADAEGKWSFSHDQSYLELAEGEHTVFAITYDPGSKVKSKPSVVSTFYVNKSPAAVILGYTNLPTTLLTLVVLLFGTLYIYSRRRAHV